MNVRSISTNAELRGSRNRSRLLETLAFVLLVILIILSPFPYGGVTADEERGMVLLAFSAAVIALVANPRRKFGAIAAGGTIALLVLAAHGLVQALPLAHDTVKEMSPSSASVYATANDVLRHAGDPELLPSSISIAREATLRTVLRITGFAAALVAAALTLTSRKRRRIAALVLAGAATLHVIGAAVVQSDEARLHGSFVNPNNFAGYLGIALAVAFALAWGELLVGVDNIGRVRSRAQRWEKRIVRLAPLMILWSVLAIGIALTRSRMGIAAAAATTLLMVVLALAHRTSISRRARLAVSAGAALVVMLAVTAFAASDVALLRFLAADPRDADSDLRVRIWKASVQAWEHYPIFGSGLGTFRDAFRQVQPADLPGLVDLAHSDSVQLLVTGGIIGLTIAILGFGYVLLTLAVRWWRERHREESAALLAALGAVIVILIHGIAEFNLSIASIPMTLAVIVGGASAARRGEEDVA